MSDLFSSRLGQTIERGSGLFSDVAANPLRDYWHVIVPYCSSDTWAGTGFSQDTGYREGMADALLLKLLRFRF